MGTVQDADTTLDTILRTVEVQGAVFLRSECGAPWGLTVSAEGMTFFHIVTSGSCWLDVEGAGDPVALSEGDLVILPHGTHHTMRDALSSPAVPIQEFLAANAIDDAHTLRCGGDGVRTTMICGEFRFADRKTDLLLRALPPYVRVKGNNGAAAPWLSATLDWIAEELQTNAPGAETVVQRLTDVLFVQAVRSAFASVPDHQLGWLRALRDERLAPMLEDVYRQPAHSWTVDAMAQRTGMSRSGFAAYFSEVVGESPMQHLTRWRMNQASQLLRRTNLSVAEVADSVGYESEAGFSKAFARHTGIPASRYRAELEAASAEPSPLFAAFADAPQTH